MKDNIIIDENLKILIIGANGFLGTNLLQFQNTNYFRDQRVQFIAGDLKKSNIQHKIPFYYMDITDIDDTLKKIKKISPNVIILTAAMTNVDQCEVDKELAMKINTIGPKNVIEACKELNSKLIFMSTDFVFDGTKENILNNESDVPNPLSHYAKSKYDAEQAIIDSEIDFLICRTSVLYGWNKTKLNFITWILKNLEQNQKISIVINQINSPTFVRNLSKIILKLIEKKAKGIYHTAGDGSLSRYDIALKCADVFNHDKSLITPIDNLIQRATRPKKAGLDISKLKKLIGTELKIYSLNDGLNYMKNHIEN